MVTPIIDPTGHANIGQGVELDAHLLIATHVCKKQYKSHRIQQQCPPTNTLFDVTFVTRI
jgi:hypothetical protein